MNASFLKRAAAPIVAIVLVVALVAWTLTANDRRECRLICVKAGFKEAAHASTGCACVTADGRTVPAPAPAK